MSATRWFCSWVKMAGAAPTHCCSALTLHRRWERTRTPIRLTPDFLIYLFFAAQTSFPIEFAISWASMENVEQAQNFTFFQRRSLPLQLGCELGRSLTPCGFLKPPRRKPKKDVTPLKPTLSNSLLTWA